MRTCRQGVKRNPTRTNERRARLNCFQASGQKILFVGQSPAGSIEYDYNIMTRVACQPLYALDKRPDRKVFMAATVFWVLRPRVAYDEHCANPVLRTRTHCFRKEVGSTSSGQALMHPVIASGRPLKFFAGRKCGVLAKLVKPSF